MAQVRELMGDAPVYITFDIDAVDPGYAPGTGLYFFTLVLKGEFKVKTSKPPKAQENPGDQVEIGVSFALDWLRE